MIRAKITLWDEPATRSKHARIDPVGIEMISETKNEAALSAFDRWRVLVTKATVPQHDNSKQFEGDARLILAAMATYHG